MFIFLLTSCISIKISEDDIDTMYYRERTTSFTKSSLFGYGRSDDIYTALSYMYNDTYIREKHGDSFELTWDNIVCIKSETQSASLSSVFKGEAEYLFTIEESIYRIVLSKNYFGKWTVKDCLLQE